MKSNRMSDLNSRNVEEIVIPPEKRQEILNNLGQILYYKIHKSVNNSTVSKFVTRKWIEVNDLSGSQYSVNKNIRFKTPMLISDL